MKDPLHKEHTPYDLLGLNPNASKNEVLGALPRFLRNPKNRSKISKAQEARKRLMNMDDRLEIDILYYRTDKFPGTLDGAIDIQKEIKEFLAPPVLSDDDLFHDLKGEDHGAQFETITFSQVKLAANRQFETDKDDKIEVIFDE